MSQKAEKYARGVERSLSGLEEHLERMETAQAAQGDLIRVVLGARTAEEEVSARLIRCSKNRAAEAERRARLWRCIALGAVVALLVVCLAVILTVPVEAEMPLEAEPAPVEVTAPVRAAVIPAGTEPVEEPEPPNVIPDCIVSYYCCERRPHICGTGDGITATGTEARPWVTCAVDPTLIPLGSTVTVAFEDGETVECVAEDVGQWVQGEHVDICVAGHREALELGLRRAVVRWEARP